MSKSRKISFDAGGLLGLAILFVAVVMIGNIVLRGVRLDLTENKIYTLSDGTYNILDAIDEPINLYFFYSEESTREYQSLRIYANRVREVLEEFEFNSNGKLILHLVNPLPFSEEEDRANELGIQPVSLRGAIDPIYLGLAGTNSVDDVEIISFFDPAKQTLLEYDLVKLVYTLSQSKKPVIGLMTSIPIYGGYSPATQGQTQAWVISTWLDQLFEIRRLGATIDSVDEEIDVLMVVHPKTLSQVSLYAIDQFVLRGGKLIAFVDPHAEVDTPPQDPSAPFQSMMASRSSTLDPLFDAWGVEFSTQNVVIDRSRALQLQTAGGPVRHFGMLGLQSDALDHDDVITSGLDNINLAMPGFFKKIDGSETGFSMLIHSTQDAALAGADKFRFLPDPTLLREDYTAGGQEFALAIRVNGDLATAFPDGPPQSNDESQDNDGETAQLLRSEQPANIILVADVDMLADQMWAQSSNFFGQRIAQAFANNGNFVSNALDNLTGSGDLISIRGRASFSRPFLKVEELEREADDRFRAKETELETRLDETESRIAELQSSRDNEDMRLLSDQQSAEIERFIDQRIAIRKELRQVRRQLKDDIERLGSRLKFINIALVPLLITLLALGSLALRRGKT